MDRYAVLGHPVAHSLSPRIQKMFAAETGQAMDYSAVDVAPEEFASILRRLHEEGWRGFNVTLPHKLAALQACETITKRARIAGAVNTLVRSDTGWRGDNTDGEGVVRDLRRLGFTAAGKRVAVLGAGGAARGILKPLLDEKPSELVIANRNPWKPELIAKEFAPHGPIRPGTFQTLKGDHFDLLINATSAGHRGEAPRLPENILNPGAACYDLSYGKAFAPFETWARSQRAARIADGLGMLVEQGAVAFELWRGVRPVTADVLAALRA